MAALIEKLLPDGARVVLASFDTIDVALKRIDAYGDPGTCEAREVSDVEARSILRKERGASPVDHRFLLPYEDWSKGSKRTSKLDESKVRQIRVRHSEGNSLLTIAKEFGVSKTAIQNIISKKTWTHVC